MAKQKNAFQLIWFHSNDPFSSCLITPYIYFLIVYRSSFHIYSRHGIE